MTKEDIELKRKYKKQSISSFLKMLDFLITLYRVTTASKLRFVRSFRMKSRSTSS